MPTSPTWCRPHKLPAHHRYLGPVLWSTKTPLPQWWNELPDDKPVVFLTFGSSGQSDLLPMALDVLSQLPVSVIAATAGKIALADVPDNARIADYLPVDIACRRAQLVICNGGSLTTYQALASGVPVIGICSNMDQLLNMQALENLGAGLLLRAARTSAEDIFRTANTILGQEAFNRAARQVGDALVHYDGGAIFRKAVVEMLGS
jgi:UDP:flavonoid glycosyltransferase YjiC (YdhE family)